MTAMLLLGCVLSTPGDLPATMPVGPVVAAPLPQSGGCGSCGGAGACGAGICPGAMDPCPFEKKGILARLRNAFRPKNKCVECVPSPEKDKSHKLLFRRFHRPVNYCQAGGVGGGCATAGVGCSSCGLPPIPGSVPAPATAPVPTPAQPVGESKPAKVNIIVPGVPAALPVPGSKPAF